MCSSNTIFGENNWWWIIIVIILIWICCCDQGTRGDMNGCCGCGNSGCCC